MHHIYSSSLLFHTVARQMNAICQDEWIVNAACQKVGLAHIAVSCHMQAFLFATDKYLLCCLPGLLTCVCWSVVRCRLFVLVAVNSSQVPAVLFIGYSRAQLPTFESYSLERVAALLWEMDMVIGWRLRLHIG